MKIRRLLTAPFGWRNDGPPAVNKIGVFPVEHASNRELIAGFNDRHFDFRIAVLSERGRALSATWVRPHNSGGRAYLTAVLPFHILIARGVFAHIAASSAKGEGMPPSSGWTA